MWTKVCYENKISLTSLAMVDSSSELPAAERDSMECLRNRVLCRCHQDYQKLKLSVTHEYANHPSATFRVRLYLL